jgi:outer membrane translocation and assembly module TamA
MFHPLGPQHELIGLGLGVEGTDDLDESPVARRFGIGNDNSVKGFLLRPMPGHANFNHNHSSFQKILKRGGQLAPIWI